MRQREGRHKWWHSFWHSISSPLALGRQDPLMCVQCLYRGCHKRNLHVLPNSGIWNSGGFWARTCLTLFYIIENQQWSCWLLMVQRCHKQKSGNCETCFNSPNLPFSSVLLSSSLFIFIHIFNTVTMGSNICTCSFQAGMPSK